MKSTLKQLIGLAIAVFFAAGFHEARAGERLKAEEIGKTFTGMTLDGIYSDGTFFSETYRDDGSIRYHDLNGSDSGEWSVRGDTFCTFYESQEGACFSVERDGANCFTFYEDRSSTGGQNASPPPPTGWTSRGWNRQTKSTCPTPPEANI